MTPPASRWSPARRALFAVVAVATVKIAAQPPTRESARRPGAALGPGRRAASARSVGRAARHRLSATQVLHAFAISYLSYLDGGPVPGLRYVSITAASQVADGGRIPAAFRDGPLRITSSGEEGSTGFSAQATVVASNRSESYPFTVQMLYEQNGWQIAQVVPVDLSTDDHVQPPVGVVIPAAGASAARRFAVAYVSYRAGVRATLPAMGSAAEQAIAEDTDSLAQTAVPRGQVMLASISYGPPSTAPERVRCHGNG